MSSAEGTGTEGEGADGASGNTDGNNSGGTSTATDEFKAPASQKELDRIIAERLKRETAKYNDVPEARKKAAEYDKLVDAQKTELERIQARAEAAEKRAADLEAAEQKRQADAELAAQIANWKSKIADATGIPANALRGTTEEELRDHAKELKALLPDPNTRRVGGAFVPAEGRNNGSGGSDPRQQFADILRNA